MIRFDLHTTKCAPTHIELRGKLQTPAKLKFNIKQPPKDRGDKGNPMNYQFAGRPKGDVLIINNVKFKGGLRRDGAKVDEQNLERVFKALRYKVKTHNDKTKKVE